MVAKRIIPCLDMAAGRVVKGVNFVGLRDAGDPVELACRYDAAGADELVFLDIAATHQGRETLVELVERTASQLFIPFTVGGGIRSLNGITALLRAGADKVSLNSSAVKDPELISAGARQFGAQCIVVAIHRREQQLASAALHHLLGPGNGIKARVFAASFDVHSPATTSAAAGIDGHHDALGAELPCSSRDQLGIFHR